ncbi:MAG: hypothetical protein ACLS6G_06275 [Christensenellales bacterium]
MRAFFTHSLKESAQILEYLHGRELSDSTIRVFGLAQRRRRAMGDAGMRELGLRTTSW